MTVLLNSVRILSLLNLNLDISLFYFHVINQSAALRQWNSGFRQITEVSKVEPSWYLMGDRLGIPGAVAFLPTHSAKRGQYGKKPWTITNNTDTWPSVPSSSRTTTRDSKGIGSGAECAKNVWVWTGCHWNLMIGIYHVSVVGVILL